MRLSIPALLLVLSLGSGVRAQSDAVAANSTPPIQALLVTGGCCHDYDRQKLILTRGISARANVRWSVVHQGGTTTDTAIPLYDDPNWADGFDIVVHNECFSHVTDREFVDRILAPHRQGTPAILIHCAMHCYRVGDDRWFEFVGLQSPGHGPHYSYTAQNLQLDHPIMEGFGPLFVAPKGELYHSVRVFDSATPLAQANRQSDGQPQVCVWTNDYHGTRVFGTTIGHYNETMAEPKYLDMLARGLLWAVGRAPQTDFTPSTQQVDEQIRALVDAPLSEAKPQKCCGEGNVALQKPVTASSQQEGHDTAHLTDGRLDTRWCASGPQSPEWVEIDLQQPHDLQSLRLHWEMREGTVYRYTVEASSDQQNWTQIVDAFRNDQAGGLRDHTVEAPGTRFLRITFLGTSNGSWGSLWEVEASTSELPEVPAGVRSGQLAATISDVDAPAGFNVTLFGTPPEVNYPVCLTTAASGEVFVGVDEQGSLGKEPGRGKILRCIDTDGDAAAERINEFARIDHPRGLIYDAGSLWVLHPPTLSVLRDVDGDGTADESEVLIEGISTDEVHNRGADHTTNGIRLGIDGWIYIAVGDFGFTRAVGKDGTTLSRRGGGVVRVRPDGTDMEIYAWGLRNIVDVAIDPLMNLYTRDNTNDGGGWDTRLSHILQTAHYGYPSLYMNFSEEIMPPLADYGGGSGCGAMYFQDARWPEGFNDLLLTCDWGRNEVFSHDLPINGPTFDAEQQTLLTIPRPTDIDVDASGRMFVSSWKNGKFDYDGPDVGFVAQITPQNFVPHPLPDVDQLEDLALVEAFEHPSAAWRGTVQRELLRRAGDDPARFVAPLVHRAQDESRPLECRVAAIFTLGLIGTTDATAALQQLLEQDAVREYAIRALTDDAQAARKVSPEPLIAALADADPRVQAAALIALGRVLADDETAGTVGDEIVATAAAAILPLTIVPASAQTAESDDWRQPHPERVLPHLAVKALVAMNAIDECLAAVDGPYRDGALWALQSMHDVRTVDGLFQILSVSRDDGVRRAVWTTLLRLYFREGEFTADSPKWWGTRPDTTGPYYDRQTWSESDRIADAARVALADSQASLGDHLSQQLKRHVIHLDGVDRAEAAAMREPEAAIVLPKADPNNPDQIANMPPADALTRTLEQSGDVAAGRELFRVQSCVNCHTFANGQQPKGPHLVDIGKRYSPRELVESIIDPSRKIAQGFDTWVFLMEDGQIETGFVVLESAETVTIRQADGLSRELLQDDIDERLKREESMMPKGMVGNLTPRQLADLIAYLRSLH